CLGFFDFDSIPGSLAKNAAKRVGMITTVPNWCLARNFNAVALNLTMCLRIRIFILLVSLILVPVGFGQQDKIGGKQSITDQKIEMTILGIAEWLPSRITVNMANELFSKYVKEKYGYEVSFTFEQAPFTNLLQKASLSLATRSQRFNIIISDSQWLGTLAEHDWIVQLNNIINENLELKQIKWLDPIVEKAYMIYPDGSTNFWGMPQEGDVMLLYVRKDLLEDPDEQKAFKVKYGFDLPQTYNDFLSLTMDKYEKMCEFFTHPSKGLYGLAAQFSRGYDFMSVSLHSFIWSRGGQIWNEKNRQVWGILNTHENAQSLEQLVSLLKYTPQDEILDYGITEVSRAFAEGKVFSALNWAAIGNDMVPMHMRNKVLIVPPPSYKINGEIQRIYSIGGQPWVINKFNDANHMKVTIDFLKWWYLPETQLEFAKRGGSPVTKAFFEIPGYENIQPWFKAYKYMLTEEHAKDFWHEPSYFEILSIQQKAITDYASGKVTHAQQVLDYVAYTLQLILYESARSQIPPPPPPITLY
ncbi:MAG: extracellular solute-binding protein, partial [Thioploca sp.]|nr:extracellular solute-binding protein [Thioploca sp.]